MPTLYAVDRFEDGDWAVLEVAANRTFRIPRSWVPTNAKEGDVLAVDVDLKNTSTVTLSITIDPEATRERLREADELRQRLPRAPKGDISL